MCNRTVIKAENEIRVFRESQILTCRACGSTHIMTISRQQRSTYEPMTITFAKCVECSYQWTK